MQRENIFIHVPKTGGTTINCAIHGTDWQTPPDFYYRHLRADTKRSNSHDIFHPLNWDKYKAYNIFMMLRHPIDRLISEYSFFKERHEFTSLLNSNPNSFEDYICSQQTQNYMVGFLLGKRIYDTQPVNEDDYKQVKNTIDNIPILVGIFEHYEESMFYFQKVTGIRWKSKIEAKRLTFDRPYVEDLEERLKKLIEERNQFDFELYAHCLSTFKVKLKEGFPKGKISFSKNKYDHIIYYSKKYCLFDFCVENRSFLKNNTVFFKQLTEYLHGSLAIDDGEAFVKSWNDSYLKTIQSAFPDSATFQILEKAKLSETEGLEQIKSMGKAIDRSLKNKRSQVAKELLRPLKFDAYLVVEHKKKSKGLFSRLFSK